MNFKKKWIKELMWLTETWALQEETLLLTQKVTLSSNKILETAYQLYVCTSKMEQVPPPLIRAFFGAIQARNIEQILVLTTKINVLLGKK